MISEYCVKSQNGIIFRKWANKILIDVFIVATHMILEVTNLNIDSTWIEFFNKNEVKNVFDLSDDMEPVYIINLGYKTDDCPENPFHNQKKDVKKIAKYI